MVDNVHSCLHADGIGADSRMVPSLKIVTDSKSYYLSIGERVVEMDTGTRDNTGRSRGRGRDDAKEQRKRNN